MVKMRIFVVIPVTFDVKNCQFVLFAAFDYKSLR